MKERLSGNGLYFPAFLYDESIKKGLYLVLGEHKTLSLEPLFHFPTLPARRPGPDGRLVAGGRESS